MLRKTIIPLLLIIITSFSITVPSTYAVSEKYITKLTVDHEANLECVESFYDLDETTKKISYNYSVFYIEESKKLSTILSIHNDYISKQKQKHIIISMYNKGDLIHPPSQ